METRISINGNIKVNCQQLTINRIYSSSHISDAVASRGFTPLALCMADNQVNRIFSLIRSSLFPVPYSLFPTPYSRATQNESPSTN
ncbi:MAG: hypothetical protein F6K55_12115 [Moorea sp. SIO4A3]|nr:hypothetical protein [Moorena sp. SIO4A3]